MGMQLNFKNPDLQAKVDQWVSDTGCPAEELVEDVMAGYFEDSEQLSKTLDKRYDDIKNGIVELLDGEVAFARLKAKSETWHKGRG